MTGTTGVQRSVTTADGACLAYSLFGETGDWLVFLHGNHEDRHVFDGRFEQYVGDYRVCLVDTRWHGLSTNGSIDPLSYELFAQDLALVLDDAGIGKAVLVGFSDGAITSILFALEHLERATGLVLIGANLRPDAIDAGDISSMERSYRRAKRWERISKRMKRERALLGLMLFEPHIDAGRLAALTMPALVMAGDGDLILPEETELIASSIPHATKVIVQDSTHNVMKHQPLVFDQLLSGFLGNL